MIVQKNGNINKESKEKFKNQKKIEVNLKNQLRDIGARQRETEKKFRERAESLVSWDTKLSRWERDFGQLKEAKEERISKEIKKKYREAEEMNLRRLEAARKQKSEKERILRMELEEEIWQKIMKTN